MSKNMNAASYPLIYGAIMLSDARAPPDPCTGGTVLGWGMLIVTRELQNKCSVNLGPTLQTMELIHVLILISNAESCALCLDCCKTFNAMNTRKLRSYDIIDVMIYREC